MRGYWTEFAKKQKQEDKKPDFNRHKNAQNNSASNCSASATIAGRLNQVSRSVDSDVSRLDRPPEIASTLASMKVKVNKLLPGSNLKGKLSNKKENNLSQVSVVNR